MQSTSSVSEPSMQSLTLSERTALNSVTRGSQKRHWGFIKTVVVTAVALYIVILIVPLVLSFVYSFTNLDPLFPTTKFIGFQNYSDLASDTSFRDSLVRTVVLSLNV